MTAAGATGALLVSLVLAVGMAAAEDGDNLGTDYWVERDYDMSDFDGEGVHIWSHQTAGEEPYHSSAEKRWKISLGEECSVAGLMCPHMDIEEEEADCNGNYLSINEVADGISREKFCGTTPVGLRYLDTNVVLKFRSEDEEVADEHTGFKCHLQCVVFKDGTTKAMKTNAVDLPPAWVAHDYDMSEIEGGEVFIESHKKAMNEPMPPNVDTEWVFRLGEHCAGLRFNCKGQCDFPADDCRQGNVRLITDSGFKEKFCGTECPEDGFSLSEDVLVDYKSGSSPGEATGFQCRVHCIRGLDGGDGEHLTEGGDLVWADEFDADDIDVSKWEHFVSSWRGGQEEFQWTTSHKDNSYLKDGSLHLHPTLTEEAFDIENDMVNLEMGEGCRRPDMNIDEGCLLAPIGNNGIMNPVMSAKLRTKGKFSFEYGRVEVRAQMPEGDWLIPTIALLPADNVYGLWPRSGSIVIARSRGNEDYVCGGSRSNGYTRAHQSFIAGVEKGRLLQYNFGRENITNPYGEEFHDFTFVWTTRGMEFFIDGQLTGVVDPPRGGTLWDVGVERGRFKADEENIWAEGKDEAPADQEFYIQVALTVGGSYFPDSDCVNGGYDQPWGEENYAAQDDMKHFWEAKDLWYETWVRKKAAFKVDYIRVFELDK